MRKQYCYFCIVFLLYIGGCSNQISVNDSPLDAITPKQWKQVALPELPETAKHLSWAAFNDSRLEQLIRAALVSNLSVETARQRLQEAQIILQGQRGSEYPDLSLSAGYARKGGENRINSELWNTQMASSYEVDLWGRRAYQTHLSALDVSIAHIGLQTARITLASQIAENYFRLWSTDRLLQLQMQSLEKAIKTRKLVYARFKGGLAISVDVDRQDVLVADLETNIADLKSNRTQLENSLAILLGQSPQSFTITKNTDLLSDLIYLTPSTPAEILRNRPDIKTAELMLIQSHISVELVRTRLYPTLNLSAAVNYSADSMDELFDSSLRPWSLLLDVTQPIFDGGIRQSEIDQEALRHQQELTQYKSTLLSALQDVESVLAQQASIIRQQESVDRKKKAQQRITNQATLKYLQGEISALDLLIDENALINVEKQEVDVWLNGMLTSIGLLRALGVDPVDKTLISAVGRYNN